MVVYPDFAYPLRQEIFPNAIAIFLIPMLPVIMLLLMQLRIRSFWDANNAIFGVLYALSTTTIFQLMLKWLIGGLRPHFLAVCNPDLSLPDKLGSKRSPYDGAGYQSLYYTRDVCTGNAWDVDDSLSSFPSGHTAASFAGMVFVYLYANAKFKIYGPRHSPLWKMLALYAPILLATLIGGWLTIDGFHNWYDVVAGGIIGTVMGVSAYRMCYAAVFDWRYNHIPLNRQTPFPYDHTAARTERLDIFGHLENGKLQRHTK